MWTLRNRLVLVNVLVFLLTFVVLVGVLAGQLVGHLFEQLDRQLVESAERAASRVVIDDGEPRLADRDGRLGGNLGPHGFVRILDAKGAVTGGSGDYASAPALPQGLPGSGRGLISNQRSTDGELLRVYTQPLYAALPLNAGAHIGYIQAGTVPEEALEMVGQIRDSLLIAIPLALAAVVVAGLFATRKALQPLTDMTHGAAAIGADTVAERRLPVPRTKDEVQALALAFNATLERLAAAFARQRRFTADASHELRTPVTAILGQAELALSRPRTPDAYQDSLQRIAEEAERMQRLIGRMLALARAEGGQPVLNFAPADVAALLRTLTETLAVQAEEKQVDMELQAPQSAVITTDADSLTQILLNLIENAIAYTDHGLVEVALVSQADGICITVADSGPGIAPEQLDAIFEPFFRADPSRQRQSGGVGLGLALAHELTRLLGGQLSAANRPEGGAVFTLVLPAEHAVTA